MHIDSDDYWYGMAEWRNDFVGPRMAHVVIADSMLTLMDLDFRAAELAMEAAAIAARDGMVVIIGGSHGLDGINRLGEIIEIKTLYEPRRMAEIGRGGKSHMAGEMIRAMLETIPGGLCEQPETPSWSRPPRALVSRGKLAPRQSFRKIMRSVNRNR